jgi:phosphoglycerate dehydrogenase-like enzyme
MPTTVTTRPKIDRPASTEEVAVIRAALERASTRPIAPELIESVERLHAIAKCGCGCESVDFASHDPANPSSPISDGTGTTSQGEQVGLIVWGDRMRLLD